MEHERAALVAHSAVKLRYFTPLNTALEPHALKAGLAGQKKGSKSQKYG